MRGIKFLFLFTLVVAVVIASGYFILKSPLPSDASSEVNGSNFTEPSSEEQKIEYTLKLSRGYTMISKPTFKVGQRFVYDVKSINGNNCTDDYLVKSTEDINDSKFFLIVDKKTFSNDTSPGYVMYNELTEIYVDVDDGSIPQIIKKIPSSTGTTDLIIKNDLGEDITESFNYVYLPWMLALKDGLSWTTTLNSTKDDVTTQGKYEYRVTGSDYINGMDCFVVESIYSELDNERNVWDNYYKTIRWIDRKGRIVVRAEVYDYYVTGELEKSTEINLISSSDGST
jgi:hypothetical protein